jgi:hypothetical protein
VAPEATFEGISKALLTMLGQQAIASGVEEISLERSLTAQRFYRECGYVATGAPVPGFGVTQWLYNVEARRALTRRLAQ